MFNEHLPTDPPNEIMILNFSYGRQGSVWQEKRERPGKREAFCPLLHKQACLWGMRWTGDTLGEVVPWNGIIKATDPRVCLL